MSNALSGAFQHADPEVTAERAARKAAYQAVNNILVPYANMEGATTARAVRNRLKEVEALCDMVGSIVKHPDVWNVTFNEDRDDYDEISVADRLLILTDAPAISWPHKIERIVGATLCDPEPFTVTVRREPANGE